MSKREAKLLITDILEAIDKASVMGNDKPVVHPTWLRSIQATLDDLVNGALITHPTFT